MWTTPFDSQNSPPTHFPLAKTDPISSLITQGFWPLTCRSPPHPYSEMAKLFYHLAGQWSWLADFRRFLCAHQWVKSNLTIKKCRLVVLLDPWKTILTPLTFGPNSQKKSSECLPTSSDASRWQRVFLSNVSNVSLETSCGGISGFIHSFSVALSLSLSL